MDQLFSSLEVPSEQCKQESEIWHFKADINQIFDEIIIPFIWKVYILLPEDSNVFVLHINLLFDPNSAPVSTVYTYMYMQV